MKLIIALLLIFSHNELPAFSAFEGNFVDGPNIFSDSGIRGPKYSDQIEIMKQTAKMRPGIAKVVTYGKTIRGRDLTALLFQPLNGHITKFALVTGATHGNEYLNIADRLGDALLLSPNGTLDQYIASGGALLIVPILNPDGYESRSRGNARWADLNRDWPNSKSRSPAQFKQPETKALADWVDQYLTQHPTTKLNFAMDYHCCVDGMLLKPWGYQRGKYMPKSDVTRFDYFIDPMLRFFPKPGKVGTPPDLLYSAKGTTLDYWYDKYKAISLTFEGSRTIEKNNLQYHVMWWEEILNNI